MNSLLHGDNKTENLVSVVNEWYSFHQDAHWYDTDKSKNDTYCGCWSYDLGAIAKILKLNDDNLKKQQYYLCDLIHFKE